MRPPSPHPDKHDPHTLAELSWAGHGGNRPDDTSGADDLIADPDAALTSTYGAPVRTGG